MARIIVESGPLRERILELPEKPVDVGRDSGCFLHIPDGRVSRHHFSLGWDGQHYVIEDKGSRNGTYVNGKRVARKTLRGGDLIRVADTFISFTTETSDSFIGRSIGGYRIDERLGRGGMGTVYRAVQISLDRAVALKVLSPALTDDREFVDRFVAEARAAAKFSHPNIIQVYNAGEAENVFFLAMEFMPGGSVQQMIDREGTLPCEKALRLVIDAARALIWAEDQSIVHRDIKPDNLLLGEGGSVKVADFGLAADRRTSKTLYVGGKVLGTPGFMAPEQALGKSIDHRADIYALGSTLYAALTGSPPFDGDTPLEVLLRKLKEDPRPLAEAAPDVPRAVVAVVEKLMAKRPEDRYQHATEAHADLEQALAASLEDGSGSRGKGPGLAGRLAGAFRRALGKPGAGGKKGS